ncbi:MAG: dihydropteroate synthase [Acidobacteria bacterium]|nr:dihydropteroate synthase [Acidobacteriota bacterium]
MNGLLEAGGHVIDLTSRPLVMAILNVTPDSFSDHYAQLDQALARAERMLEQGCDWLDIGGESTRPGSESVDLETEWQRVGPVIRLLRARTRLPLSIDTRRAEIARRAGLEGVDVINHVSASLEFEAMIPLLCESQLGYIAMHMKALPKVMQAQAEYRDVILEVATSLGGIAKRLNAEGIASTRVLFDPGIGFGKTLAHNLALLANCEALATDLGRPLVIGLSRKRWLGELLQLPLEDRDAATATASALLPFPAVAIHRVHNIVATKQALRLREVLCGP